MTAAWRRLRGLVTGEAGVAPAATLAAAACVSTLISVAAPRVIAASQTAALRQEISRLAPADTAVTITAQWTPAAGNRATTLGLSQSREMIRDVAKDMRPPLDSPPRQRWASVTTPAQVVANPAARAVGRLPPIFEVAYRSALTRHARLLRGSLPGGAESGRIVLSCPGLPVSGRARPAVIVAVAVTAATAARFAVAPGSRIDLCPPQAGDPALVLQVTGVLQPSALSSVYWQYDPVLAAPALNSALVNPQWFGGAIAGPGALAALQTAYPGSSLQSLWYFPLNLRGITPASLPRLLTGIAGLASVTFGPQVGLGRPFAGPPTPASGLGGALSPFLGQLRAAGGLDSLLAAGLSVAALILLLVCARLAAQADRAELGLLRARGASTAQAAARLLGRSGCVCVPAAAAGAVLAVLVVHGGGGASSWVLGAASALIAIAGPAGVAVWEHRRSRPGTGGAGASGRTGPLTAARLARLRRWAAELTVLAAAAGAVAGLRGHGLAGGDPYLSASAVLVAAAAAAAVARLYPVAMRMLLAAAAARPGAVGFLGLARSARSQPGAMLPALALVLALTLAGFAGSVTGSIGAAQRALSWQMVGADVLVHAAGDGTVTTAAQRAVRKVPGVTATAVVYLAAAGSPLAAQLVSGTGPPGNAPPVGLLVADPAQYAALATRTPWPRFPAGLLARPRAGHRAPVPVLASPAAASGLSGGHPTSLVLDGIRLPVRIAGRIGATPAMPGGGRLVVMPEWAERSFPSIPGPDTLLAAGATAGPRALRAVIARFLPGSQLTLRQQVLAGLAGSPAQRAGYQLSVLGSWMAAALAALAALAGLAMSARERRLLATRLAALGMGTRQARALALTDTIPLLAVAILGTACAVLILILTAVPGLGLGVFTGYAFPVPVRPGGLLLLVPAAALIALVMLAVLAEQALPRLRAPAGALRQEEVS